MDINELLDIGEYPNYKPKQPIKFSHKVHEGIEIDCHYCHNTKHKDESINTSVCTNCHQQ